MDMFRNTLHLLVETPENPFVAPVNIEIIESFMQSVGYQGVVDKKKDFIHYSHFTKLIITDLIKKFPSIPPRLEEDYHSIKDDILLVSVYTTGNVTVRGMLILDAFLTNEILATDDYKEYETMFVKVVVLMNQPQPGKKRKQSAEEINHHKGLLKVTTSQKNKAQHQILPSHDDRERDEIAEATLLSLALHKTAIAAEAEENVAKVQEKLAEEEIEKMVEGDEDEESYASEFADSMINDDDDLSTRIRVIRRKTMMIILILHWSELMQRVVWRLGMSRCRHQFPHQTDPLGKTYLRKRDNFRGINDTRKSEKFSEHCNNGVPELTFEKINEMIKEEMPRLVDLAVQKDREIASTNVLELISKEFATHGPKMIEELFRTHMQNTTLNLYPTTSLSTAEMSTIDLQY
ncbi:hypothetical protein Tco_0405504 [Tanacetum coccineum]